MEYNLMLIYLLLSPWLQDSIGIFLALTARCFIWVPRASGEHWGRVRCLHLHGVGKHLPYPGEILYLPVRVQEGTWGWWGFMSQRLESSSVICQVYEDSDPDCSPSQSILQPARLLGLGRRGSTAFSKSSGKLQKREEGTYCKIISVVWEETCLLS